jgi:hypothetical protein
MNYTLVTHIHSLYGKTLYVRDVWDSEIRARAAAAARWSMPSMLSNPSPEDKANKNVTRQLRKDCDKKADKSCVDSLLFFQKGWKQSTNSLRALITTRHS